MRIATGLVIAGLAIVVAFLDTRASLAVLLALPFGYVVRSRIDKRIAARR